MAAFFKGFYYAAKGVARALREERNLRFHVCAAFYVVLFSFFYAFTAVQYALLAVLIAGVLALEMVNSALERAVDLASPQKSRLAETAKNMAAGAVLVFAAGAAVCGVLLFWNTEVFGKIYRYFADMPWLLIPLAASFGVCGWFVFGLKNRERTPADEHTRTK